MIRFLIRAISRGLGFSKTEARGTLALTFLLFIAVLALQLQVSHWKNTPLEVQLDTAALAWVQEAHANIREKAAVRRPKVNLPSGYLTKDVRDRTDDHQPKKKHITEEKKASPLPLKKKDLNTASSDDLQTVRGIGPVLSERIVNFRTKLGGFFSTNQMHEVYGLDSAVVLKVLSQFEIQTPIASFAINSDSIQQLAAHPYISYDLARVIINYRKAHGNIQNAEDLRKIKAIDEATFKRLKPYLE